MDDGTTRYLDPVDTCGYSFLLYKQASEGSVLFGAIAESVDTGDRSYPPSESNAAVIESIEELVKNDERLSLREDADSDDETGSDFSLAASEPPFPDSVHNNSDNDE